jgi:hypothetical protein
VSANINRVIVFVSLLSLSLLVHLALSWKVGEQLVAPPVGQAVQPETVELDLSLDVPVEEQEEELFFDDPIELEAPAVLMRGDALRPPPVNVDLALNSAAGGVSHSRRFSPVAVDSPPTAGSGLAGFGEGVGDGQGLSSHQFAAYVQSLRESGLDVMFVVDATGSMDWVITEVRERIVDIVDTVRSLIPIARFGVVAYRDFDDPEFLTIIQPLTFSLAKLTRFLSDLRALGGDSWHEAISAGVGRAVDDAGWRVGASKVIILIGDAPPHPENINKIFDMANSMLQQDGQVSTLDVSHDSNPALLEASLGRTVVRALYRDKPMLQFQAIADAGGGVAATMDGDVQITRQLLNLIMGGKFSSEMSLLLDGI